MHVCSNVIVVAEMKLYIIYRELLNFFLLQIVPLLHLNKQNLKSKHLSFHIWTLIFFFLRVTAQGLWRRFPTGAVWQADVATAAAEEKPPQ